MVQILESTAAVAHHRGLNKGYIQVYTGDGKGKTTAAIGLTVRALGAGLKVYIAQFMKDGQSSEIKCLERLSNGIKIEQFMGFTGRPRGEDKDPFNTSLNWSARIETILLSRAYEIVILEEISMAVMCGLVSIEDLLLLIESKPHSVELVLTGRYAHPKIIAAADLVTEMKEVKHYFYSGVKARLGIEK